MAQRGFDNFLIGWHNIHFSVLERQDKRTPAPLGLSVARTLHANAKNILPGLMEYIIFGFFIGREIIGVIGILLAIYFLYKHFWRELGMLLIGLGGGGLIGYFLSLYFGRQGPAMQIDILPLTGLSFPSQSALLAVLGYGLLAYLLIPRMPSNFWKWLLAVMSVLVMAWVGFSGLMLGGNYLTDVIAGYALGFAWAALIYTLMEKLFENWSVQNQKSPLQDSSSVGLQTPGLFGRRPIFGVILILLAGLSFAALAYNLRTQGPLTQVDTSLYNNLITKARAAPPVINEIMLFGFFMGKQVILVIVPILCIYFLYQRFWCEFGMLLISSAGGSLVWNFFIAYFSRPRPPEQMGFCHKDDFFLSKRTYHERNDLLWFSDVFVDSKDALTLLEVDAGHLYDVDSTFYWF